MRRKVIQIADSTQLISLPRKWALKQGLKKGDEVNVEESGSTILVSTEFKEIIRKININVAGMDRDSLIYAIRAMYTQGFDEMTFTYNTGQTEDFRRKKNIETIQIIENEVNRLHGVEIFSQTNNHSTIKSISTDTEREFDNLFNRILFLVSETIQDYNKAYEKGDKNKLKSIEAKHDLISKFVYYCARVLSKGIYKDINKTKNLTALLNYLDLCVDSIKYCARITLRDPHKPSKQTIKHFETIHSMFSHFMKLYKKFSLDELKSINKNLVQRGDEFEKLIEGKAAAEARVISYMNTFIENLRFLVFSTVNMHYAGMLDKEIS